MIFESRKRIPNAFMRNGRPLVVKVGHLNGDNLRNSIETAVHALGGLGKVVASGDSVLLKPNFNCAYALPLSTELGFLAAVIELLMDAGARVSVGESAGRAAGPTDGVVEALRVLPMLRRYGVPFINFDHDEWVSLRIASDNWDTLRVPRSIYEADKRIYLPNMRCHSSARFSASLKLGVGWIDSDGRDLLHGDPALTEVRIAELNLAWQPHLVLMDGRRSTVAWHGRGEYVFPNMIMASGDMVAIDAEAVKTLKRYPEKNRLDIPLEEMGQFEAAQRYQLGSLDYELLDIPAQTHTEEQGKIKDPAAQYYETQFEKA